MQSPRSPCLSPQGREITPKKYAYIDALRGMAILGVISLHCAQAVPAQTRALGLVMVSGVRGVQLFYIASAITLCMSWAARRKDEASPIRNYFLRRFWRIAPLFYVAMIAYLVMDGFGPRHWAPNGIRSWFLPVTALMLHGWHPETINGIVPGGWSIAVEFTFYLVLPAVLSRIANTQHSLVFLCVCLGVYVANAVYMPRIWEPIYPEDQRYLVEGFTFFNIFSQLPVFAIGVSTYFAITEKRTSALVACLLLAIVAAITSSYLTEDDLSLFGVAKNHLVTSAVLGGFVLALSGQGGLRAVLVNPATVFLGKISYGLYLTHFAVIRLLKATNLPIFAESDDVCSLCFLGTTLCIAAVCAIITKRLIEDPFIDLGRRMIAMRESGSR
jgi:peptidoglycan/LPS O-acetylase OafA/YrhL